MEEIEDSGWSLGAIYHSHTRSEPYPSQTDIGVALVDGRGEQWWPGTIYVIVGVAGDEPEVRAMTSARGATLSMWRWRSRADGGSDRTAGVPELRRDLSARRPLLRALQDAAGLRGAQGIEAPVTPSQERARKIKRQYAEGDLVRVAGGRNQA
jgi:hypothetical protein